MSTPTWWAKFSFPRPIGLHFQEVPLTIPWPKHSIQSHWHIGHISVFIIENHVLKKTHDMVDGNSVDSSAARKHVFKKTEITVLKPCH